MKLFVLTITLMIAFTNMGLSQWEEKGISTTNTILSVNFLNEEFGVFTMGNEIHITEDGGDLWNQSYSSTSATFFDDILMLDETTIIAVGKNFDSGKSLVVKTTNGGIDWVESELEDAAYLQSIFFTSDYIGYCAGGGTILKTTDRGESWEILDSGIDINLHSISFTNDSIGIAVGGNPSDGIIIKTNDGGENWREIISPSSENLQSVFFINQETATVVGWNGEIIKTIDCGETWTVQSSVSMQGNLDVVFTNESTGYIVGGDMNSSLIQKTIDGGDSWEDISPDISQGLIDIDFPSENVGYAVGASGTVLKTESAGVLTSTKSLQVNVEYKVFPNPLDNNLQVVSENGVAIDFIKIYGSNGALIKELKIESSIANINFSSFEANLYYLEILSQNKVIIKRVAKI